MTWIVSSKQLIVPRQLKFCLLAIVELSQLPALSSLLPLGGNCFLYLWLHSQLPFILFFSIPIIFPVGYPIHVFPSYCPKYLARHVKIFKFAAVNWCTGQSFYRTIVQEKATFRKHSVWSNVLVDVLLGLLFGVALWFMAEPVCSWVSNFSLDITNYWLRTGCVWLMGDPAGFKLNNELAGILGMISLTAIQIWSTLWGYTGFLLIHFARGLSLCGILFGLTTAAALVIDTICLVTMHIWALHLFLALLYSTHIKAVAALWRLFRGKKWNPLRHRLDSYEYTVEQHVVGSLLFTPIFLLLPTTSAFYIFFTILYTAVCITCIVVEVAISFIHVTPYAKILLWLKSKRRFPSGIWFEVTPCRYSETGTASSDSSSPGELQKIAFASNEATVLVSFLHSNYLNLGEVVWPHYKEFFSTFSWSSIASSAHGLLSGKSIPSSLVVNLPLKLPRVKMPWKEYWRLCHDSVYSCRRDPYNQFCK